MLKNVKFQKKKKNHLINDKISRKISELWKLEIFFFEDSDSVEITDLKNKIENSVSFNN